MKGAGSMTVSIRGWFVSMVLVALAAGCGDGGDLGADPAGELAAAPGAVLPGADLARAAAPLCDRVCDARVALACPRDGGDCARTCADATGGSCGTQWTSYFSCFVDSAPGQRVCSALGQADLAPGVCAEQHGNVQRCLIAALSGR
jgi:hypothetical protein